MKPQEKFEKLIKKINVSPHAQTHSKILNDVLAAQEKFKNDQSANLGPNIWKIIMKSRITKFATAAVITVAVMIGMNKLGGSVDGASAAWAGIVKKCHSFKTVTYTQTMYGTFFHQEKEYDLIQTKYCFACGKYKETRTAKNPKNGDYLILTERIIDENNEMIFIDHETKCFFRNSLPDSQVNPMCLVSMLKSLPSKADEVLGKKVIDGKNTIGFLLKGHGIDLKLWIHDETYNPVMVVFFDDNLPESQMVYSDFCFDVDIDESQFDAQLPSGYSKIDPPAMSIQPRQCTVNDFIYYLKLHAKYSEDGCFPDEITISMDKEGLLISVGLSSIDSAKCTKSALKEMSVRGPRSYQFLSQMKPENDWHYAGKGISPEQLDTPICWWKEDGSEYYTVIFADLSIETLTEDQLPIRL